MSDLLKKALTSKKPIQSDEDYSSELLDKVPELSQIDNPSTPEKGLEKYAPLNSELHLPLSHYHKSSPIYISKSPKSELILFCVHGAGLSGASFSLLASEVRDFANLITYDILSHGNSKNYPENPNFSIANLVLEAEDVLKHVLERYENSTVVLIGHSLGGAVVAKLARKIEFGVNSVFEGRIQGVIMIDVVEGTSKKALPFMKNLLLGRPKYFASIEKAVQYMIISGSIVNLESARISTPPLFEKIGNKFYWKCNLMLTEKYWEKWFDNLNRNFLESQFPKILILAAPDRMDKELTICHMQGKFKMVCVKKKVGHHVHEDSPREIRDVIYGFLKKFKVPLNVQQAREKKDVLLSLFDNKLQ